MNLKKSISLVLTLCMVFSLFATFVFPVAAEGTTYTLIDTVEELTAGTYYMGGVVTNDGYGPYQIFSGSVGTSGSNSELHTSLYTYTDGVLATESDYPAAAVELAAVEGKENTYTIYVDGKGYITCTGVKRALNFSDTACEWVVSNNAKGGITFSTTVSGSVTYMGINQGSSSSPTKSKFIRNYSGESTLTSGLVFFAEDVEEAPVTSQVVTHWNSSEWGSASEAHIFTEQEAYLACAHTWWAHVSFKPTDEAGIYEVVERRGATGEAATFEIAEGGFVWLAHDQAAEGTPGAYAHALIETLKVGDFVAFTGLDIANCTTTEDATAEKYIPPVVAENVALNKGYEISGCGEPYGNYTANLTDGNAEQAYALNDSWFAFYNNGTHPGDNAPGKVGSIIIDLGALYNVESINVNALDAKGDSGINAPAGLKAYFSEDGETWGEAITLSYTLPADKGAFVAESAVSVKAQFVKVEVTLNGVFAFINEIEVYGILAPFEAPEFAGENVALNKGYTYPTANLYYHWSDEWTCTDNVATAITDGVRVAGYYGKGETSGWGGKEPRFVDIVIDLEAVYDISGFAYVLTGGADGILHPASVEILVSDDNETFTPVSVKTVSGNQYFGESWSPCYDLDYYATPAAAVAGRYVKFIFNKVEGTNFIFINELEVYGTEAVVEEDDDSFKDTYTHVDGETVGTTQSRGEGWESLLVPDFWYVVEDGETEVTIKVAVDNRVVAAEDTMLRVWIDADPSDTARTTLVDTKVKDGAAYVARVDGGLDAAILSQTYSVIGNDYYLTVVLDKAALGIDGQYGLMLTLSETGYNSMHNVAWDVEDVAGAAPWNTTKDYILYGEEPVVEYNEVVVDVNANAMLTDGKTGFAGGWNVGADANKVLLIANGKCTTNPMKVVVNYALGETKTIDALVLDFYHCAGVMIGYPEGKVLVEYSVDGTEYVALGEYDLEAVTLSTAADGTVSSTLAFDAVDAAYVRATFVVGSNKDVLGNSPADGKIFWEFAALAEVAVNEASTAPEYDTGWNVEYDDTQIKILSGNEAFVAALTDNVWAEGATSFGTAGVLLVQNLVCKNPELYPELTLVYNAGTAIDVNNIKVGLYVETNSMIGYPSEDAKVYVSTDGIEWTPVDSTTDIPESVFVQHGNSENSLGTYVANIEFATSTAQYVKVVFTYTDSPFNDPNGDYKPVYEFIGFTEAEVSYVEPTEELPEDATGLDIYGYTHTHINYVMYVDADMTLGELVTKYFGQSKDLNYFKVIVVNEDGTVAATYLTLGRPDGVKTDIAVTAGQYVLALSADGSNEGRFEIADTVKVGDIVTLYNVDFTAEPGELTNAGFTVEAAVKDLPSGRGFEVLVPANGSVSYVANFTNGADFMLYDTSVTVLVNGVALDASEGYYEAKLEKGDVVTFENATAEDIAVYPMAFPVIYGTMSNPFVLEELGDLSADITMDLIMNGGAAHYIYIAPADGKVTVTMLDASWTYTVNNLTAGLYGDAQWSDSDPVLKSYTIEVSEGDEIQIIVGTYDAENPWAAPEGKVNFTVEFEAAKTFVTGEFSEGGELNKANAFAANAHNIWNKDFSGNSWWGVTVLEWNAEENAWEVVKVLLSGADTKDGTLTETQIALAAHVDNAAAYASITALQVGDIVYIWDAGVATTDKLVDGVDANGGFYTTDPEKTGTTALTYKKVEFLAGDANMNGKIDANDYATIRKLVVGSLSAEDVDAKTLELADVNGNGKIDANDYILVKRHVLGTYTIPAWEDVE